jgi:hypothetical protein
VGPYLPTNASKAGLLEETRQFLTIYVRLHDVAAACRALINGELPQRSRETRTTIVKVIKARLVRWDPPQWVLDDLASFAADGSGDTLKAALLLHAARQDTLLYDVTLKVIAPLWEQGCRNLSRADVQRFLDGAEPTHSEISGWSRETREKLAGNLLSILRDYGLLVGSAKKQIVEPLVPAPAVVHLARLLIAEGFRPDEIVHHPDWRIWLWDAERAAKALRALDLAQPAAGGPCHRETSHA